MRYLQQLQVGNSQNWLVTRMTGFRQKFFLHQQYYLCPWICDNYKELIQSNLNQLTR